jgi:hypothetical protein
VRSEGVTGYPAAYLIDQKGIIRMAFSGWGEETARKWYEGPPFASEIVHDGRTASLFDPGARTFLPLDGSVSLLERTGRLAMPTLDRTAYLAFRNREEDHERVLPIAGTENVLLVQEEPRLPIDSPARTQTKTIHLRVV